MPKLSNPLERLRYHVTARSNAVKRTLLLSRRSGNVSPIAANGGGVTITKASRRLSPLS
jgi:hypothetical protein